jgi:hypothetical protein
MDDLNLDLDLSNLDNELKTIDLELADNTPKNNVSNNNFTSDSINTSSLGTDIGLDLLTNKKKQRTESSSSFDTSNINIGSSVKEDKPTIVNKENVFSINDNNDSFNDINNINLDNLSSNKMSDNLGFNGDSMMGPTLPDLTEQPKAPEPVSFNTNFEETKPMTYEEIQRNKFDLLCKFERLRDKGMRIPKTFSMSSDYDEMKYEYERLTYQRKMDTSVKMQRHMLISMVTGMEFLNSKFDPFSIKLDNWSEQVNESIHDYDDIFEELYEKYKDKASMAPEMRLIFTVLGSAFMFHLSNTMFKSAIPGMGDIMKQNPDLMKEFGKAAATSMGNQNKGFGGFMGNILNNFTGGGAKPEPTGPPLYDPMSSPPFANPTEPPKREFPPEDVNATTEIDNLLSSISESKDLGNEKEITLDLKNL